MPLDFSIPAYLPNIAIADSMEDVLNRPFTEAVNCYVYPRSLSGDFNGLALIIRKTSKPWERIWTVSPSKGLHGLQLLAQNFKGTTQERAALEQVIQDAHSMKAHGFESDDRLLRGGIRAIAESSNEQRFKNGIQPHHDDGLDHGITLVNYLDPATGTAKPDDFLPTGENTYTLKPGTRIFDLGVFNVVRFATASSKNFIPPFRHFGQMPKNKRLLLVGA